MSCLHNPAPYKIMKICDDFTGVHLVEGDKMIRNERITVRLNALEMARLRAFKDLYKSKMSNALRYLINEGAKNGIQANKRGF